MTANWNACKPVPSPSPTRRVSRSIASHSIQRPWRSGAKPLRDRSDPPGPRPERRSPDVSITEPNVTRAQSPNLSPRLGPRTTRLVKIIGAAAIALLAASSTLANAAENLARLAQEQHACAVVLGLDSSGRRYDACIRSLETSLLEWDYARTVSTDRNACARQGLQPGTPAFAVCVVKAERFQ